MNCGWCLSYQKDSFCPKQDQALGFLARPQNLDTNDQLSSITKNQLGVGAIHLFSCHLYAM